MKHSLFLAAVEATAKTVRTLLTTPQLTRPFREPFTPECMRGETWLADKEAEEDVAEPRVVTKFGHHYHVTDEALNPWQPPWWSAEGREAHQRKLDTPLSATFTDEPPVYPWGDSIPWPPEADLDYDGPVGEYCFGYAQSLPLPNLCNGFGYQTPAVSATDSAVEDLPDGCPPRPSGTDSQIVELTADAQKRVADWLRASVRHGKSDADLVRGFQRLVAVSDKAEP